MTLQITRSETEAAIVFSIKTPEAREFSCVFSPGEDEQKIRAAAVRAFSKDAGLPAESFTFTN